MNWYDYVRGYDDGKEYYLTSRNRNNLLIILLQLAFYILSLLVKLCFLIAAGLAALLWAIIKAIAGRFR